MMKMAAMRLLVGLCYVALAASCSTKPDVDCEGSDLPGADGGKVRNPQSPRVQCYPVT